MKKIITALAISLSINSYAQITLEHTYTSSAPGVIQLSNSGYKYYLFNNDTLKLYDLTHALYKTIVVPFPNSSGGLFDAAPRYISETLFNTDNLIEFIYSTTSSTVCCNFPQTVNIVNENGSVLFSKYIGGMGIGGPSVVNVGNQFKLFIPDTSNNCAIYSLPGTLPCDACGGFGAGIQPNGTERMSGVTSQPMPNPSDGNAGIKYTLPNGTNKGEIVIYNMQGTQVKTYMVDKTFDTLVLSNTDLAAGTYFYQLKTNNGFSDTKKMFIIR